MTDEQFAEMYAMGLFNQEETSKAWSTEKPERRTWQSLTKKERNRYRTLADTILEEIQ